MYHYGIKGMKWGVRRFETKGGKLTPAGKKRYADDSVAEKKQLKIPDKKSQHRQNLEAKYQEKKGMSQQEAEQAAARRIRGEKYAVAAAAVTVASCVAYCKYKNYSTDKELSENTDFQRIMNLVKSQDIESRDRMYVAYNKKDKTKYKGILGKNFDAHNDTYNKLYGYANGGDDKGKKAVYDVSVKAKQKIKVASRKRAQDTFMDLYKNDEEFNKNVKDTINSIKSSPNVMMNPKLKVVADRISKGKATDIEIRSAGYDIFNIGLADQDGAGAKAGKKFFDSLKKQGMNAIQDINDKKYSGYDSKDPLIIFDGAFDYAKREMSSEEIASNYKKAMVPIVTKGAIEGIGAVAAASKASDKVNQKLDVKLYKKQHPNTQMSDKEILEMLKRENKKK